MDFHLLSINLQYLYISMIFIKLIFELCEDHRREGVMSVIFPVGPRPEIPWEYASWLSVPLGALLAYHMMYYINGKISNDSNPQNFSPHLSCSNMKIKSFQSFLIVENCLLNIFTSI